MLPSVAAVSTVAQQGNVQWEGEVAKVYEQPVIRDYGDLRELTAVNVAGQTQDDGVQKSSDLGVIKQGG